MKGELIKLLAESKNRNEFWAHFINAKGFKHVAELGVYRGRFAESALSRCKSISEYVMIDPWRKLDDWNKPANEEDDTFEKIYKEAMKLTEFAASKRKVLRGKTTEVINQISHESLDFAYIDADHTLKGITIDLINIWPKIKQGGFIGGDDFGPSVWQHSFDYEPTMVFPYAVYFAEAMGVKIYALPYNQFLMEKDDSGYEFIDLTNGQYSDTGLRRQLVQSPLKIMKRWLKRK